MLARNYSINTIKRLFAMSGNRCSYQGCGEQIFTNDVLVADIIHIEALRPGEPRYNSSQTDSQRNAFDNLMVMCKNHHAIIDNDESHTVELLKKWKASHEGTFSSILVDDSMINQIIKSLGAEVDLLLGSGFSLLENNYFAYHQAPENSLDLWQNGFPFDLTSIKLGLQYTRSVVPEIIEKLDSVHNLLLLGEMGYGKTTVLMELICHYHDLGYVILYNLTGSDIINVDNLLNFIDKSLKEQKEVLLVIDNVHDERTVPIFHVIDRLSTHLYSNRVKIIMAARIPEFNLFIDERLQKVNESYRIPVLKFKYRKDATFHLNHFTKEEIGEFLKKYNIEKSLEEIEHIFVETNGIPVLIKFSIFGKGIDIDVKERCDQYLHESGPMKTMILCSILELGGLLINDEVLEELGLLSYAYRLQSATLHKYDTVGWKTLHPIWDLYFLILIFHKQNKALVLQKEKLLQQLVGDLFNLSDKQVIPLVIRTLYYLVFRGVLQLVTVEKVVRVPPDVDIKTKCRISMTVGMSYLILDNLDKAIEKHDECLLIDKENIDALNDKGVLLFAKGGILKPINCYNEVLALKPDSSMPLNNLGLVYDSIWCYYTAINFFENCISVDPLFAKAWYNKGRSLDELGDYEIARQCYDKAIDIDPIYAEAWHNKGVSYHKQLRFEDAINCYNRAIYIDPAKSITAENILKALRRQL